MMAKLNAFVRNPLVYVGLLLFGASFMLAFQALPIPKVSVAWSEELRQIMAILFNKLKIVGILLWVIRAALELQKMFM